MMMKVQVTLQISGVKSGNTITVAYDYDDEYDGTPTSISVSDVTNGNYEASGYYEYGKKVGLKWAVVVVDNESTNAYQIVYISHDIGEGVDQDHTTSDSRTANYYSIPALSDPGITQPATIIIQFKEAFKLLVDNGNDESKGVGVEVIASSHATQDTQNDGTLDNVISNESTVTIKVTPADILSSGYMFIGFWCTNTDGTKHFETNATWNVQSEVVEGENVYSYTVSGNDMKSYKELSVSTVEIQEVEITRDFSSFGSTISLISAEGYALVIVPGQTTYQLYDSNRDDEHITWYVYVDGETVYSGSYEEVAYYLNNTIEP